MSTQEARLVGKLFTHLGKPILHSDLVGYVSCTFNCQLYSQAIGKIIMADGELVFEDEILVKFLVNKYRIYGDNQFSDWINTQKDMQDLGFTLFEDAEEVDLDLDDMVPIATESFPEDVPEEELKHVVMTVIEILRAPRRYHGSESKSGKLSPEEALDTIWDLLDRHKMIPKYEIELVDWEALGLQSEDD